MMELRDSINEEMKQVKKEIAIKVLWYLSPFVVGILTGYVLILWIL
jgi:hypothetical protein